MNINYSKYWSIFSTIVLIASAGWVWISAVPDGTTSQGSIPVARKGFRAPDFSLPDAQGEIVRLYSLRGQPVVINLWASWCTPCRAEMPAIQKVFEQYEQAGLVVLGVNATNQDNYQNANNFANEMGLTFPILFDNDGVVSRQYVLSALPTTFFVDGNGIIQDVVVGGPMSEALLRIRIEQLIENTHQDLQ